MILTARAKKLTIHLISLSVLGLISIGTDPAYAWPPTYGTEYNFGSVEMRQAWFERGKKVEFEGKLWQHPSFGSAEHSAAKRFKDAIKAKCGNECQVTPVRGKFPGTMDTLVEFSDGYHFTVSIDPACIEIITSPETLQTVRNNEARTQKYIFDVARELGFKDTVADTLPAHLNIGLMSAFDGDAKGFMRFFTNYHNFAGLSFGAIGANRYKGSPLLSHLSEQQRAAFSRLVEEVNADRKFSPELAGKSPLLSHLTEQQRGNLPKLVDEVLEGRIASPLLAVRYLYNKVYTHSPAYEGGSASGHYQAISVKYIGYETSLDKDAPFELRDPRQPETAAERTLLIEFIEKRIEFEKKQATPIAFLDLPKRDYTPSQVANQFRLYLAEMGADWNHFKPLLPAALRKERVDNFMAGRINWDFEGDIELMKYYTQYLANSEWVRRRMESLLTSRKATKSGRVQEILDSGWQTLGKNANSEAIGVLDDFIESSSPALHCVRSELKAPAE